MSAADYGNNRVLLFAPPFSLNDPSAYLVLGQPNFTSGLVNNGGAAVGMNGPFSTCLDGTHFVVADSGNNRVLIWNSIPTLNQQPPNLVLGQPDFNTTTANTGGISAQSLSNPQGVYCGGGRLVVSDRSNSRVLIWNSFPTTSQQPANLVLGAANMSAAGSAVSTNTSTPNPGDIGVANGRIFIADYTNNRVEVWNNWPSVNGQTIDMVLGQPSFTTSTANNTPGAPGTPSAYGFISQLNLCTNGTQLVVGDNNNARVLIWNSLPTVMQQPADLVLGQPNFASNTINNTPGAPGTASAQSLGGGGTIGVTCDRFSLMVSDRSDERVLVWNNFPTYNQQPADLVIGQPNMSSIAPGTTATSFNTVLTLGGNFLVPGVYRRDGY